MIRAPRLRFLSSLCDSNQCACEVGRRCRASALIIDDLEGPSFARNSQHRAYEISSLVAVHPGRPHDDVIHAFVADSNLAGKLGFSVDIQGTHRVIGLVGQGRLSVEDVIGRDVNDPRVVGPRSDCDVARSSAVHGHRLFGGILCGIDGSVCGRIEYDVRLRARHSVLHGARVGDVELRMCERRHIPALRACLPRELGASHATGTCDENPHLYGGRSMRFKDSGS
jgi:hypothetical protein